MSARALGNGGQASLLADPTGQSLCRSLGFVDYEPSVGMRLLR